MSQLVHTLFPRHIYLLSGVAIASSLDFMLPAGTPPNAIVLASGRIRVNQMVRVGLVLDLVGALLCTLWTFFAVRL
jgi:sodium-dependent dicarboxylate transporter 2/3/5